MWLGLVTCHSILKNGQISELIDGYTYWSLPLTWWLGGYETEAREQRAFSVWSGGGEWWSEQRVER